MYCITGNSSKSFASKKDVVTSTERKYVIAVVDGRLIKKDISTGNENIDKLEIYGNLKIGDSIIANATEDMKGGIIEKH